MADFTMNDVSDFVNATRPGILYGLEQVAQEFTEYNMLREWFSSVEEKEGRGFDLNWLFATDDTAGDTDLNTPDSVVMGDGTQPGYVPFVGSKWYTAWDKLLVITNRNAGPNALFDYYKSREVRSALDRAGYLERAPWRYPTTSTDKRTPWGIPMFVQASATRGFNGGDPTGFSGGYAGCPVATVPQNQNYTDAYSSWDDEADGFPNAIRIAMDEINFQTPNGVPDMDIRKKISDQFRMITTHPVTRQLARLGRGQNQNNGADIDNYNGEVRIRGVMPIPSKSLAEVESTILQEQVGSATASGLIYLLNKGTIGVRAAKGINQIRSEMMTVPNHHNWIAQFTDFLWNFGCVNRRMNAVVYSTIAVPTE